MIDAGEVLLTGAPDALVAAMRGRIWRKAVDKNEIEDIKTRVRLVSTRLQAGQTIVRAYSEDGAPEPAFEPVEAELEDVYFAAIAGYLRDPAEALA